MRLIFVNHATEGWAIHHPSPQCVLLIEKETTKVVDDLCDTSHPVAGGFYWFPRNRLVHSPVAGGCGCRASDLIDFRQTRRVNLGV